MKLKNNGVTISCDNCRHVATGADGAFDVRVPVGSVDGRLGGVAQLRCVVNSAGHTVELVGWQGVGEVTAAEAEALRQRILGALDFVAAQRICGKHRVCPAEVVRIVGEHGAS